MFDALGAALNRSPKTLTRLLGPVGEPQAGELFEILLVLQKNENMRFGIRALPLKAQSKLAA